jgi:hypothetical protein
MLTKPGKAPCPITPTLTVQEIARLDRLRSRYGAYGRSTGGYVSTRSPTHHRWFQAEHDEFLVSPPTRRDAIRSAGAKRRAKAI